MKTAVSKTAVFRLFKYFANVNISQTSFFLVDFEKRYG